MFATDRNEPFEFAVSIVLGTELPAVPQPPPEQQRSRSVSPSPQSHGKPPPPPPTQQQSRSTSGGKPPLPQPAWISVSVLVYMFLTRRAVKDMKRQWAVTDRNARERSMRLGTCGLGWKTQLDLNDSKHTRRQAQPVYAFRQQELLAEQRTPFQSCRTPMQHPHAGEQCRQPTTQPLKMIVWLVRSRPPCSRACSRCRRTRFALRSLGARRGRAWTSRSCGR